MMEFHIKKGKLRISVVTKAEYIGTNTLSQIILLVDGIRQDSPPVHMQFSLPIQVQLSKMYMSENEQKTLSVLETVELHITKIVGSVKPTPSGEEG